MLVTMALGAVVGASARGLGGAVFGAFLGALAAMFDEGMVLATYGRSRRR